MSKRLAEEASGGSKVSPRDDTDAHNITCCRRRLARLIGRLLARHWMREKLGGRGTGSKTAV